VKSLTVHNIIVKKLSTLLKRICVYNLYVIFNQNINLRSIILNNVSTKRYSSKLLRSKTDNFNVEGREKDTKEDNEIIM